MHDGRFDDVVKRLKHDGTSRRAGLRAVAAATLIGAAGRFVAPTGAAAKKRKKKAKAAYQCADATDTFLGFQTDQRGAVRFTASRTGTLRQITFSIDNPNGFRDADWVVQLVHVVGGVPSNSPIDVLAAVTVADASVPEGETTITGSFAGTKITQGEATPPCSHGAAMASRSGCSLARRAAEHPLLPTAQARSRRCQTIWWCPFSSIDGVDVACAGDSAAPLRPVAGLKSVSYHAC